MREDVFSTPGPSNGFQRIELQAMSDESRLIELMQDCESQFAHVWMVRTFLKHSPEAEEDEEVAEVHRLLYDVMLALGPAASASDATAYFRQLKKKMRRLREANDLWQNIQPEVSGHMNYRMSATSLAAAVAHIEQYLAQVRESTVD